MNKARDRKIEISYDLLSKYRGALMGFAILCIIMFHFTEDCNNDGIHNLGLACFFYRYVGSSSVDTFLLLSGFGLFYSMKRSPEQKLTSFYLKRYTKVLIPYLLIAIPALLWRNLHMEGRTFLYFLSDLSFVTFFREGRTWFWYILIISICYLIFPYLFQLIDKSEDDLTAQTRVMALFSLIMVVALMEIHFLPGFYKKTEIALHRFLPFILGCYLGRVGYSHKRIAPGVLALCVLSVPLVLLRNVGIAMINRYVMAFFNFSLCLLLMLLLEYGPLEKVKKFVVKGLEWVGKYTLELYLCHVMVRGVLRILGHPCSALRYEALMLVITLILSLLLKWLTNLLTGWITGKAEQ